MYRFLISIIFLFPLYSKAKPSKEGVIRAGLAPVIQQNLSDNFSFSNKKHQYGGAFLLDAQVNSYLSIEVDIIGVDTLHIRNTESGQGVESVFRFNIPIIFRFHLFNFLSIGTGVFASYASGEVESHYLSSNDPDIGTSAHDTAEHGLLGSIQLSWKLTEEFNLVVDQRYLKSVTARPGEDPQMHQSLLILQYATDKVDR